MHREGEVNSKMASHPLIVAAILFITFFASLHPLTGGLGGMLFWLTGWAIPSAIIILISFWASSIVSKSLIIRGLLVIPFSAVLGLTPSIFDLSEVANYEAQTEYEIKRVLNISEKEVVTSTYDEIIPIFPFPLKPRLEVGGNEGCGCMFFRTDEFITYRPYVIEKLKGPNGPNLAVRHNYKASPMSDVHFRLLTLQDPENEENFIFTLETFDHDERISVFTHRNIPKSIVGESSTLGKGNFEGLKFFQNSFEVIVRNNFWHYFLTPQIPSFFPDKELDEFVNAAIIRTAL